MEGAPNIHDRLTRYTITPSGGEPMMEQLSLQHQAYVISQQFIGILACDSARRGSVLAKSGAGVTRI